MAAAAQGWAAERGAAAVCFPVVVLSVLAGMNVPSLQVRKYARNSGRFSMASQVFVGRQRELAVLAELAAKARADQPQVVLVEGEAGMGKSSLITRFVPAVGGTAVLRASGEEGESTLSYGVISQVAAAARSLGAATPALLSGELAAGHVVWTYNKALPVLGGDSAFTVRGSGVLPVADTPYGRLTTVICFDASYPGLLRQAGQKGADILLVPTHQDYPFEESANAAQAVYRAIENGTSLVRPSGDGTSLMTDYLGRVIASQNYSASNNGILLANVPTAGVSTISSRIGDAFAYLCTIGLLLGIHQARRAKRSEKRTSATAPPKQPQAV